MKIRKGKNQDVEKLWILEIESRIYHKSITNRKYTKLTQSEINEKARVEFLRSFKENLKRFKPFFLVTEIDKKIVGYIIAEIYQWDCSDKPTKVAGIDNISVLGKFQNKGIGTKLIKEFEKIVKKKGIAFLIFNLWKKNKLAYNLCKKNKFDEFSLEMVKKLK